MLCTCITCKRTTAVKFSGKNYYVLYNKYSILNTVYLNIVYLTINTVY